MSKIAEEATDFSKLPEACISFVMSLTSPRDSCVSSAVSTTFKSAVDSDTVWEKFLPSDYQEILSRTVHDVKFSSKRDLYFKLCSPVLIDGGKMSFQLEKSSGAKCFMISSKELSISWLGIPEMFQWRKMAETRFQQVAYHKCVWLVEIDGKIGSEMLTKKTRYAAYLVYRLDGRAPLGRGFTARETTIKVGMNESKSYVQLNEDDEELEDMEASKEVRIPSARNDGWLEIEMGEFYNDSGDDGDVLIRLLEPEEVTLFCGISVYGIEVRPKK